MGKRRTAVLPHQRSAPTAVPDAEPKYSARDYATMVYDRLKNVDEAIAALKANQPMIGPRAFQQQMNDLQGAAVEASRHALLSILHMLLERGR